MPDREWIVTSEEIRSRGGCEPRVLFFEGKHPDGLNVLDADASIRAAKEFRLVDIIWFAEHFLDPIGRLQFDTYYQDKIRKFVHGAELEFNTVKAICVIKLVRLLSEIQRN